MRVVAEPEELLCLLCLVASLALSRLGFPRQRSTCQFSARMGYDMDIKGWGVCDGVARLVVEWTKLVSPSWGSRGGMRDRRLS